jgi:hypothetical protein
VKLVFVVVATVHFVGLIAVIGDLMSMNVIIAKRIMNANDAIKL